MPVVAPELPRGAGGRWCAAHVLQLVGFVSAVVVPVAHKVPGHAPSVLAGELVLLARLVGAALLIAVVAAVVASVASDDDRRQEGSAGQGRDGLSLG